LPLQDMFKFRGSHQHRFECVERVRKNSMPVSFNCEDDFIHHCGTCSNSVGRNTTALNCVDNQKTPLCRVLPVLSGGWTEAPVLLLKRPCRDSSGGNFADLGIFRLRHACSSKVPRDELRRSRSRFVRSGRGWNLEGIARRFGRSLWAADS